MKKLVEYLDNRGRILAARLESKDCINREEQEARLAEINGVIARLAVLSEMHN